MKPNKVLIQYLTILGNIYVETGKLAEAEFIIN